MISPVTVNLYALPPLATLSSQDVQQRIADAISHPQQRTIHIPVRQIVFGW